jgi:hypothetical protein
MRSFVTIFTVALITFLNPDPVTATQKEHNFGKTFPAAEGKKLEVDVVDLDVRLRNIDVDRIDARIDLRISGVGDEKGQRWIENHTPAFVDSQEKLEIKVEPAKSGFLGFGKLSARARIAVMAAEGVIPDITTSSGNIHVRGDFALAEPLRLRTSAGSIDMVGAAESLDIRSAAGDAQIEVVRPLKILVARTSSGDIQVIGGAREARVDTASGNIRLENLSGSLTTSTSTGKMTISWDRLGADETIRIRSSSGRVHLMLPEGVHPQGTLRTTTGNVRSEFPGEVVGDGTTLRLTGDGPTFDVETASGEILLTYGEIWE